MVQSLMGCGRSCRLITVRQDDHRRALEMRARDAVHRRRNARTERGQTRTDLTGQLGLRKGCDRRAALRRREYESESRAARGVDHIEAAAAARHAEERADAGIEQSVNDQIGYRTHALVVCRWSFVVGRLVGRTTND